ncbi:GspJ family T2SS minor pseudopilin variant LspJ [Legionella sp. 27cVA30]|uniref:GspJ family T2SS minor pseudopilin variant LspJ n=1 Tax=Legionella sp. 27cVA30 TaxID=2905657 RepID=UPI00273A6C10|nr:GspJ family T2SS minor pseudopilin variant LspJ [Legionella sp. 27cVA30]
MMQSNRGGYTLIEILIALAVFAILAIITASAMYYAFDTRNRVNLQAERLNILQLALSIIARDIEQCAERPIRGNELHVFSAYIGQSNYTEFTRGGLINPNAMEQRSTLKRIAYLCRDGQLIRRSWEALDTPQRSHYEDKVLLDNLTQCKFAYLNRNRQILTEWRENAVSQNQKREPLPTAVQFTLNLQEWGEMSLLFIVPEALYGP